MGRNSLAISLVVLSSLVVFGCKSEDDGPSKAQLAEQAHHAPDLGKMNFKEFSSLPKPAQDAVRAQMEAKGEHVPDH